MTCNNKQRTPARLCDNKQRRRTKKGVITVEAAFVMPIVIFIIMLLLQYSLILYDRLVINSIVFSELENMEGYKSGCEKKGYDFTSLAKQRQFFLTNKDYLSAAENNIRTKTSTSLLFSTLSNVTISEGISGIEADVSIKHRSVFPYLSKMMIGETMRVNEKQKLYERENKTRLATVIIEAVSKFEISKEEE